MMKKGLTYLLAAAMTLSLSAPAAFGSQKSTPAQTETVQAEVIQTEPAQAEQEQTETVQAQTESLPDGAEETAAGHVWNTDIRIALQRENDLRQEAGMSLSEWDAAVSAKKQEGKDAPLTKEAVLAANPDAQILEMDAVVYMIDQADALGEIPDALEAYRAAYSAAALMGGNELADLRLWHRMDIDDMRIYSFQQIADSRMVMGSTMKIAVRDGKACAVFSSLDPESGKEETLVTQEQAEEAVRAKCEEAGEPAQILPEYTDRVRHMPVVLSDLNLDEMDDDPVPEEVRWVIYTRNEDGEDPYTANYVDLAGNFLESLPVQEPGCDEAQCGFRKQDVFEGMEADTWTGEIRGMEEDVRTVTLPVMRDAEGRLYLGDVNRRIAVADFAKAVYDDSHQLELVQSDDNAVFDNEDLYMYYNYLNAWDFYADMGWIGPDGEGTDVIILKNLCTSDGTPFENACSLGMVQGWQMFGYTPYSGGGRRLGLACGLDVLAHEYTHTFTSTVMNSNLYENDQGAINEAMSDIMGNLVEYILGATDDTRWTLGEKTGDPVRSMSDPIAYQQPAYVWDKFYGPQTDIPNDSNDRGGVHINSSLLNHIAAKLCLDGGMQYEDAVRFWIMTTGGLTPKTDYPQICALMNWAAAASGNEAQSDSLNRLIEEEHLDREEIPEKLPYDRKIVHLALPENETFADENWTMLVFQLNKETIGNAAVTAVELVIQAVRDSGDTEEFGRILSEFLNSIHLDGNRIGLEAPDSADDVVETVKEALRSALPRLVEQTMAWRSSIDSGITFVTNDDPAFYMLLNISESGMKANGASVLIGKHWINLTPFLEAFETDSSSGGKTDEAQTEAQTEQMSILEILSGMTADQWASMFDLAMAVREVTHPDQADDVQAEDSQEELFGEILEFGTAFLEYLNADEEEKAEGILLPAKTQELPTDGLERVQLIQK